MPSSLGRRLGAVALYVANFGSYDKTYGTLGGVDRFLVWLWITNMAILLGAEFNAEMERAREIEAGVSGAEDELKAPERDAPSAEAAPADRLTGIASPARPLSYAGPR